MLLCVIATMQPTNQHIGLAKSNEYLEKKETSLTQLSVGGEKNDFGFSVDDDGKKIPILYYLSKQ